jgi:hypothetical protein
MKVRKQYSALAPWETHVPGGLERGATRWALASLAFVVVTGFGSWMGWW